jgi:hypothetical protein
VAYALGAPLAMLVFSLIGNELYPPLSPAPVASVMFSAIYFGPLVLLASLPGLFVLVTLAFVFGSRGWIVASALAAAVVLAVFAFSSNVMCRVHFFGPDCWGGISFQLTEKSPFTAEYSLVFWATVLCSLLFWTFFVRRCRQDALTSAAFSRNIKPVA